MCLGFFFFLISPFKYLITDCGDQKVEPLLENSATTVIAGYDGNCSFEPQYSTILTTK